MALVEVTLKLPSELVQDARHFGVLTDDLVAALLQAEIARRLYLIELESEAEWEELVLNEALGDALALDGTIDYNKLRSKGSFLNLEDFQ